VTEKVGRIRTCQIAYTGLDALEQWVREHRTEWDKRAELLGKLLENED
jgi:hypothetical protein